MSTGRLFDDDDPKASGKGVDRKGTKKDGLKWMWHWVRQCDLSWHYGNPKLGDKRRLPCQSCYADLPRIYGVPGGASIHLHVSYFYSHYEAAVEINGDQILSDKSFKSRLDAQLKAENLIRLFCSQALKIA